MNGKLKLEEAISSLQHRRQVIEDLFEHGFCVINFPTTSKTSSKVSANMLDGQVEYPKIKLALQMFSPTA